MKIACPKCQQHYSLAENDLGRNLECICGYKFSISEEHKTNSTENQEREKEQEKKGHISDYFIIKPLGVGGAGQVFLADHPTLNIPVALKILSKSVDDNLNEARRFVRESQLAAQLNHPNILRIFDSGLHDDRPYYVMEYTDKGNLAQKIERQGKLSEKDTRHVAISLARALRETHKHKIVHRDIKPENIMIGRDGGYQLADLGLAKTMTESSQSKNLTGINATMGTPHFMPPEQALNAEEADIRADIYSLGVSLYQCLTGKLPFMGKTTGEILKKQLNQAPPPIDAFNPEASQQVIQIIAKCLAKNPDHRFQSPTELEEALLNPQEELQTNCNEASPLALGKRELIIIGLFLLIIINCAIIFLR